MRCYYFGCWNESGHYLRHSRKNPPSEQNQTYAERHALDFVDKAMTVHLDGTLAPRDEFQYVHGHDSAQRTGRITWQARGATQRERDRIHHGSWECPMGQYLLHKLENGYTAIQWWDRTQGDKRGACNSTVLLEGDHTAEEMIAALKEHFPSVLDNLTKAGVQLVEVKAL